jgi:hypothetical protein
MREALLRFGDQNGQVTTNLRGEGATNWDCFRVPSPGAGRFDQENTVIVDKTVQKRPDR